MGPAHTSSSPPRTKSTPALRHARDSIQSPHVRFNDTSINPGLTDLRDIGDASEELSVLDLPDENQSIAPRASPGTRDGRRPPQVPPKPSPNPRTSIPGQDPENTVPHPPQPDPRWSLSNLTDISASIPPVRSDPLTDRAVTAAGKCYNHATTILEVSHAHILVVNLSDALFSAFTSVSPCCKSPTPSRVASS